MIALALMLALSQAGSSTNLAMPVPRASARALTRGRRTALPALPDDWSQLPVLRLRGARPAANAVSTYVRDEVQAGRCSANSPLQIDVAVLVAASGRLRKVRPDAIGCPTVEQYASGLVMHMAQGNIPRATRERWYRLSLTFAWQ